MDSQFRQQAKAQLQALITAFGELRSKSEYEDLSGLDGRDQQRFIAMARAAISRISGQNSPYVGQMERILDRVSHDGARVIQLTGIAEALLADLEAGYLQAVEELIHAELFADFLEMASHLIEGGYKDAAAVIAGSSLEGHLRQLCQRNRIDVEVTTGGTVRPKKVDQLNAELTKGKAYSKLEQKNVTAWLDLRNKAAHGHYNEYAIDQVRLMIDGVRDFITRNSA